jgi:hypothetical protein
MTKALLLSLILAATATVAQQGTRPDPMAGQSSSSTSPGANPTDTPQAKPNESPAAQPEPAPQGSATTQPTQAAPGTDAQPPASQPDNAQAPSTEPPAKAGNDKTPPQKPQGDAANFTAHIETTPPVSGSPETKIIDASAVGKHTGVTGAADPLMDVPPLPKGKPTLIGGIAVKVDRIRSRVTVEPYGAKNKMQIMIDERSHIFRNGVETTILGIKKGDRVYFDTMLDGAKIFAKNVRVISETGGAEVRGQITSYDPGRGVIQLQDALSSRPVSFRITSSTQVRGQQGSASASDLAKGALIDVVFAPDKSNRGIATQVVVLARPGVSYTFAGVITNVNVRDGVVSVENQTDGKIYDIEFDPRSKSERNGLHVGNAVNIAATFDGENYKATTVTVTEAKAQPKSRPDEKKQKDEDQQ